MNQIIAALQGIPYSDEPAMLRRKSRDFFWYSPVLRGALEEVGGDLVVTPRNEAELIQVLRICHAQATPVTVRGAGTGNYGQAMPLRGGVVLETTGLKDVIWARPGRVRAQSGIRMIDLERHCRGAGAGELRILPSTVRAATLGGFIAGGSGGVGAITWGMLRDRGNVVAARVVTMEAEPRVLELRGEEVQQVNHAYGTNGVITELELALAPATEWTDLMIGFPDFRAALHFGQALGEQPGIQKRLLTLIAAPVPQQYFDRLGSRLPPGWSGLLTIIARSDVEAVQHMLAGQGDARIVYSSESDRDIGAPIYEYAWNHTTMHALRKDRNITYLQVLFPAPGHLELVERAAAHFGDEVPMHIEFVNFGGHIGCFGVLLVRFTTPGRLKDIMLWFEDQGCPVFDAHAFTLEEGGMKQVDQKQLAFKRATDPQGLLNPGKMLAWDMPDWKPERVPLDFLYRASTTGLDEDPGDFGAADGQ